MKNQKTMGNKGFSLVELIVVIAIMVVLVAVLAPVFTRYVERSRRSTDVSNANAIAESVLTDVASGELNLSSGVANSSNITSIKSTPKPQGSAAGTTTTFSYNYDATTNKVMVTITGDTHDLTDPDVAAAYQKATGTNYQ